MSSREFRTGQHTGKPKWEENKFEQRYKCWGPLSWLTKTNWFIPSEKDWTLSKNDDIIFILPILKTETDSFPFFKILDLKFAF